MIARSFDREPQERHAVADGSLEPVGKRMGASARTVRASSATASACTGPPASIIRGEAIARTHDYERFRRRAPTP